VGTTSPPGKKERGRLRRPPLVAAIAGLALIGVLVFAGRLKHRPEQAPAVQADKPSPSSQPAADSVDRYDAGPPEAVPIETLPPAPPTWSAEVVIPQASAPTKRNLPAGDPGIAMSAIPPRTAPAASAPATPAAAAKCQPPWYFDARGNRLFKKECL